jgi:hypothetical protein
MNTQKHKMNKIKAISEKMKSNPILWLILAVLCFLIAYVPNGYLASTVGMESGWELINKPVSFLKKIWGVWQIASTTIGNA